MSDKKVNLLDFINHHNHSDDEKLDGKAIKKEDGVRSQVEEPILEKGDLESFNNESHSLESEKIDIKNDESSDDIADKNISVFLSNKSTAKIRKQDSESRHNNLTDDDSFESYKKSLVIEKKEFNNTSMANFLILALSIIFLALSFQ